MQRRNFRMPLKSHQNTRFHGNPGDKGLKRDFEHWVKGLPSVRKAPNDPAAVETGRIPPPDDQGRWQDDGGRGGDQ